MGENAEQIRREIEETRERMNDTVDALGYKADVKSRVKDAVTEKVETVKGSIGDTVGNVRDKVVGAFGSAGSTIGDGTSGAADGARRAVGIAAENPIGLAIGGVALGFLAGLILPVTDLERRKLGPIRDSVMDKAQTVIGDAVEHGKAVVGETLAAAKDSAQNHGTQVLDHAQETLATDRVGATPDTEPLYSTEPSRF